MESATTLKMAIDTFLSQPRNLRLRSMKESPAANKGRNHSCSVPMSGFEKSNTFGFRVGLGQFQEQLAKKQEVL